MNVKNYILRSIFYRKVEYKCVSFILSASTMNAMRPGLSWNWNVIHCSHSQGELLQAEKEGSFMTACQVHAGGTVGRFRIWGPCRPTRHPYFRRQRLKKRVYRI